MAANPDDLVARVLHRDAQMLIIDKPAGIAVHAAVRGQRSLEDGFDALCFGLTQRPGLAHRLDRDTSGCLVLGRHRQALARLGQLFAKGLVRKTYWAVATGTPPEPQGHIALALTKQVRPSGWRMVVDPAGQPALTEYRVLGGGDGLCWLELEPRTGRTHQLRVHGAAIGCPLLGDSLYGRTVFAPGATPLHLHARSVAVPFAPGRPPVTATAPVPDHMRTALTACGFAGE